MAYELLEPYIEKIDKMLAEGVGPSAIARELKIENHRRLISKYKQKQFDVIGAASIDWELERHKNHVQRFEEGKRRIIDSLELVNTMKFRAMQMLNAGGDEVGDTDIATLREIWRDGGKLADQALSAELKLSGDDPGSKAAESFLELVKLANQRRSGCGNSGDVQD